MPFRFVWHLHVEKSSAVCPPWTAMLLDGTRVLLLLALCCCSTHALTPGGVVVRRSVQSEWPAGCAWIDITAQLSAALPPLPTALCHMHAPSTSFALVDGGLLDALGDTATVPASGQPELALAVQAGSAVLPLGARVVAIRPAEAEGPLDLSLSIETADAAADAQPPAPERLARATLQAALAATGVPLSDIEALEVPDRSSAAKVFSTFIKTGGAGSGAPPPQRDALQQAAVRAAHHISHLLRGERAAACDVLRNIDT